MTTGGSGGVGRPGQARPAAGGCQHRAGPHCPSPGQGWGRPPGQLRLTLVCQHPRGRAPAPSAQLSWASAGTTLGQAESSEARVDSAWNPVSSAKSPNRAGGTQGPSTVDTLRGPVSRRARPSRKGFAHTNSHLEQRGEGETGQRGQWDVGARAMGGSPWVPPTPLIDGPIRPRPVRAALGASGLTRRRPQVLASFWSSAPLRGGQGPAESQEALPARGLISLRLPPAALLPRPGPVHHRPGGRRPSRSPRRRAGSTQITGRELPAAWGGRLGAASQRLGSGVQARAAPLTQAGGGGGRGAGPAPAPTREPPKARGRGGPPVGVLRIQCTFPGSPEPTPWAWPPGGAERPCLHLEEEAPEWQLPGRGRASGPGGSTSHSAQGSTEPHPQHLEQWERLIPPPGTKPTPASPPRYGLTGPAPMEAGASLASTTAGGDQQRPARKKRGARQAPAQELTGSLAVPEMLPGCANMDQLPNHLNTKDTSQEGV